MILFFTGFNAYFRRIPSGLSGLALAIASLGLCWENVIDLQGKGQVAGAALASFLVLPIACKFLFNPDILKQELKHPIAGSVIPTITMAIMLIANNIAIYHFQLGVVISLIAIIVHLFFLLAFIVYRARDFKFIQILPSWFIPPIGLALALITFPGGLNPVVANVLFSFTVLAYILMLPIVLYRLLFSEQLSDAEKPFLVILATPASLLLVCYFIADTQPSMIMVITALLLAILMTFLAYFVLIKLLHLPFSPAYSAFTFPLVVGAIALFKTSQFLLQRGIDTQWVDVTLQLANVELVIATVIVVYVSLRYTLHFCQLK